MFVRVRFLDWRSGEKVWLYEDGLREYGRVLVSPDAWLARVDDCEKEFSSFSEAKSWVETLVCDRHYEAWLDRLLEQHCHCRIFQVWESLPFELLGSVMSIAPQMGVEDENAVGVAWLWTLGVDARPSAFREGQQ